MLLACDVYVKAEDKAKIKGTIKEELLYAFVNPGLIIIFHKNFYIISSF